MFNNSFNSYPLLFTQHLLQNTLVAIIYADEEEYETNVNTDAPTEMARPLVLVHQPLPLAIKVDGNQLSVRVHYRRSTISSDGVR